MDDAAGVGGADDEGIEGLVLTGGAATGPGGEGDGADTGDAPAHRADPRRRQERQGQGLHGDYEAAKTKLQTDPQDPTANLTAGRYECLVAGKWDAGSKKLAAGSDETLRSLAAKDLAAPGDLEQQTDVGDGWWELAKQEAGTAQGPFCQRCGSACPASNGGRLRYRADCRDKSAARKPSTNTDPSKRKSFADNRRDNESHILYS